MTNKTNGLLDQFLVQHNIPDFAGDLQTLPNRTGAGKMSGTLLADDTVELDDAGMAMLSEAIASNEGGFFIYENVSYVAYIQTRNSLSHNPANLVRYHFANCRTISKALGEGSTGRFVARRATSKSEERFPMRRRNSNLLERRKLYVCHDCMAILNRQTGERRDTESFPFVAFCKEFADNPQRLLRNIQDHEQLENDILNRYEREDALRYLRSQHHRAPTPERVTYGQSRLDPRADPIKKVTQTHASQSEKPTAPSFIHARFDSGLEPEPEPEPAQKPKPNEAQAYPCDNSFYANKPTLSSEWTEDARYVANGYRSGFRKASVAFKLAHGNECSSCKHTVHQRHMQVHHIDFDKTNDRLSNWEVLCIICHCKAHRTHRAQMTHNNVAFSDGNHPEKGSAIGRLLHDHPHLWDEFYRLQSTYDALPDPKMPSVS